MKTCVLITGTNAVGKSSLANEIIRHYGGVDRELNDVTYLKEGRAALAGYYGRTKYGGVDSITNDKGSSCTSRLPEVVKEGLANADIIFCEGMYLNTFGLNLQRALFAAKRQLVVNLYAPHRVLYERIVSRSNGKKGDGVRNWKTIFKKQEQAMISAKKYRSIGIPVIQLNTDENQPEEVLRIMLEKLSDICV
jgi:adenylate kinase family enzyme